MVGMELLNMAAQHNKEAFEMLKKVNIAMALVETYMATINAFQKGNEVGGPVLGFIYAAVTAAAGAAKIAQLRSVQYSGAREKGGPVGSNQSYLVGERGPELFVPNAGGTIVPNDQMGNGPVTVNFNINVVDSEQFDTLLYKRRGLITGIINDAMTKRGREGVI
jgi:hypothetical protein